MNELFINSLVYWKGKSMNIVTIGIDLAKNVFAVHGVDATGKPALVRPSVPRAKLLGVARPPRALAQSGCRCCYGCRAWQRACSVSTTDGSKAGSS
jgi:transposase